ncbi:type IV secretion system DNA-binding domain-containing protein, partial [Hoeflea sp. YIM 152468]|uniref:type IV secretion system DNA-binding domain-containing protein n=1 Tax=Hoeflea sp. YIM 152468 TaxID=3031759 RepID=UPI0023DBEC65
LPPVNQSAILTASNLMGPEPRQAVFADILAQPLVSHVKGPRLVAGKAATRSLAAAWAKRFGGADPGVEIVAGLTMPRPLESEHILLIGGTGAGKTTVMETIMDGAIKRGDRLLALDVKGGVTARFPVDDFCLLALGDGRSSRWMLGLDIVTPEDAAELATEIIRETNDPSWSAGARQVLTAILVLLQSEAAKRGKVWSWTQLDQILSKPVAELFRFLRESDPVAASLINVEQDQTQRQAMSFYFVLAANAGQMAKAFAAMGGSSRNGTKSPDVSIRRWARGAGSENLILRQSRRQPELSAAMSRIVLKIVADNAGSVSSAEDTNPPATWLFLDELPQLGRLPAIPRLAAIGRSLGVRIVAAIQSPAQLKEIYGADGAQHLLDNLTTKIVGRVASGSTATEISSSWIGNRTVAWMEDAGLGVGGKPRLERKTQEIPVVDPQFLANDLGLTTRSGKRPCIRALVIGHGDVAMLTWPVGRWSVRRPADALRHGHVRAQKEQD